MTKTTARFLSRAFAAGLLLAQLGAPSVYAMHGANNEEMQQDQRVRALQGTVAEQVAEIDGLRRDIRDRDARIADLELGDARRCLLYRLQKIYENIIEIRKVLGLLYFSHVEGKYPLYSWDSRPSSERVGHASILKSIFEVSQEALINPHDSVFLKRKLSEIHTKIHKGKISQFITDFLNNATKDKGLWGKGTWFNYSFDDRFATVPMLLEEIKTLSSNLPRLGDDREEE